MFDGKDLGSRHLDLCRTSHAGLNGAGRRKDWQIAGDEHPRQWNGESETPFDGLSLILIRSPTILLKTRRNISDGGDMG